MKHHLSKFFALSITSLIITQSAFAQGRLSDEMIPPEVTLTDRVTSTSTSSAASSAASAGSANAPGMVGGGQISNPEIPSFTGSNTAANSPFSQGSQFNNQFASQMEQMMRQGGKNVDVQKLKELQEQMMKQGMQPPTAAGQPKNATQFTMNQNQQTPQPPPTGHGSNPNSPPIGQGSQSKDPVAVIETSKGTIVIRLFRGLAPKTTQAFLQMCSEGFYNGLNFHRYEPGFVIQGGCPNGNGTGNYIDRNTGKPRYLPLEITPALRHNSPGVVAMARSPGDLNSASCQFYITLGPKSQLDQQYTIFGGVVRGMEVVNNIRVGDKIINIQVQEQN